jgi:hypothetical protein
LEKEKRIGDGAVFGLSIDPKSQKFPSASPYSAMANDPVNMVDPDGQTPATVKLNSMFSAYLHRNPNSMFSFLLTSDGSLNTDPKNGGINAGHTYSYAWLDDSREERVGIEDAFDNQKDGSKIEKYRPMSKEVVLITDPGTGQAWPINKNTALQWEKEGKIPKGTVKKSPSTRGWGYAELGMHPRGSRVAKTATSGTPTYVDVVIGIGVAAITYWNSGNAWAAMYEGGQVANPAAEVADVFTGNSERPVGDAMMLDIADLFPGPGTILRSMEWLGDHASPEIFEYALTNPGGCDYNFSKRDHRLTLPEDVERQCIGQ